MQNYGQKISKDPSNQYLIKNLKILFRYLDGTLALNNDDFSMYTAYIYPIEQTLNKAKNNNEHNIFLILDIYIIIYLNLYDSNVCVTTH